MNQITIPISGMSCGGCVRSVGEALRRLPGVHVETVTVGSATLEYDASITDRDTLFKTIEAAGYVPLAA